MRIILILLVFVGMGFFVFRGCSNAGSTIDRITGKIPKSLPAVADTSKSVASGAAGAAPARSPCAGAGFPLPPSLTPAPGYPGGYGAGHSSVVDIPAMFAGPHVEAAVLFANRALPDAAWLAPWTAAGLHVVPDPVSRRIYCSGPTFAVNAFKAACASVDAVPGGCGLKVWMIYVSDLQQRGWDLSGALGAVLGDQVKIAASPGSFILNADAGKIALAMDAIADGSLAQVLQQPCIELQDGQPAAVESTQEYPVSSSVLSNGVTQTTVTFKKIGLVLTVTPLFLERDRVSLHVEQDNGVISATVKIGSDQVPIVDTQRVSSAVTLGMGQSVVLGGVKTTKLTQSKGFLHDTVKTENGSLYVVLSVSTDIPKALPVLIDPPEVFPFGLDGQVLPSKRHIHPTK